MQVKQTGKIRLYSQNEVLIGEVEAEGHYDGETFYPHPDAVVKDGKVYIEMSDSDYAPNEYFERAAIFIAPVDAGPPILHDLAKRVKKLESFAYAPVDLEPAIRELLPVVLQAWELRWVQLRALLNLELGRAELAYESMVQFLIQHTPNTPGRAKFIVAGATKVQQGKEALRVWIESVVCPKIDKTK